MLIPAPKKGVVMKPKYIKMFITVLLLVFNRCYPTYQATKVDTDSLRIGNYSDIQAKLFKSDNSIILFPDGFNIDKKSIWGTGIISDNSSFKSSKQSIELPLDSITAMITYENNTSGGRYFASFFLGLTGVPLTLLSIYCISCPKCCFGSCPTVYTYDGEGYNLEVELFSECIARQIEDNDIDLLKQKIENDFLKLKITNEALETHFINKFEVVVAEHPIGTELFPTMDNELLLISNSTPVTFAISKNGINLTDVLTKDDNIFYRSGVDKVNELRTGPVFDWIDIKVPTHKNSSTKMVMKYRNTLLSTTLLYDVVIGSQGAGGLEWTNKMNNDHAYASQFKMIYDAFSGIKIKLFDSGVWKEFGKFKDAGPLNWKYIAAELPGSNSDSLFIRLEFIPDNIMIDYIAFDTTSSTGDNIETNIIYPVEVTDGNGNKSDSLLIYVQNTDLDYLKTEPGDSYYLDYKIPSKNDCKQTFLIRSKGYYNEWIRGSWINNKNSRYTFNLYDIKGTLSYLADSWIENSELLEREFFHSKFSLKEEK
jgi:hypothetical protein